jgi:hypothetical protein
MKTLSRWLGANEDDIKTMIFESLKTEGPEYKPEQQLSKIDFPDKPLPEGSLSLKEWADFGADMPAEIVPVREVLIY